MILQTPIHSKVKTSCYASSASTIDAIILPKTKTARLSRRSRRCCVRAPLCTILQHPGAPIYTLISHIVHASGLVFGLSLKQRENVLHAQLANGLATLKCSIGKLSFSFLKLKNPLFDRVVNGETIHSHVDCLVETMNSINGLLFNKLWIG
jgi:hypothetical protein